MVAGASGKRIAIIPARGGSKRIPGKNIRPFLGKPLIGWTVEAALESGVFEAVVVSTDDPEIAAVSRSLGAEVPFLRAQFADDHSPVSLATLETLERLRTQLGRTYTTVVQLFAVCPLRNADEIVRAVANFEQQGLQFQLSCFDAGWAHPWWAHTLAHDGRPTALFPEVMSGQVRSQDLAALYCPSGAIWVANIQALRAAGTFYGPDHRFFPLPWQQAIDIDTPEDFEMAEAIAAYLKAKASNE
ncbi:MAG: acylneuraminate cytidylyltransferase family protein [Bacteroidia bacterium]|nr:acylneuraminate cytidylyltransferase family protein [Bacteroidia bacterium]